VTDDLLVSALRDCVGERHCLIDPDLRAGYETDWTRRFAGTARAVVRPGSVEEVTERLRAYERAGCDRVMPQHLLHTDLEPVRLIGRELAPALA